MNIFNAFKKNGNCQVTINGVTYSGNNISIGNGCVIVDGQSVDKIEGYQLNVEVLGDVDSITTASGDITCKDVGSIKTASGDVECGNVSGNITTASGDVECQDVGGNVTTMSGDISR